MMEQESSSIFNSALITEEFVTNACERICADAFEAGAGQIAQGALMLRAAILSKFAEVPLRVDALADLMFFASVQTQSAVKLQATLSELTGADDTLMRAAHDRAVDKLKAVKAAAEESKNASGA